MAAFLAYPPQSAGPRCHIPPLHSRCQSGIIGRSSGPTGRGQPKLRQWGRSAWQLHWKNQSHRKRRKHLPNAARDDPAGAKRGAPCGPLRWPMTCVRSAPASKAAGTRHCQADLGRIHEAVLTLLETVGFANAIPSCIEALTRVGATSAPTGASAFHARWSRTRSATPRATSRCTARTPNTIC